jgi:hypothetical protein
VNTLSRKSITEKGRSELGLCLCLCFAAAYPSFFVRYSVEGGLGIEVSQVPESSVS